MQEKTKEKLRSEQLTNMLLAFAIKLLAVVLVWKYSHFVVAIIVAFIFLEMAAQKIAIRGQYEVSLVQSASILKIGETLQRFGNIFTNMREEKKDDAAENKN